MRLPCKAVLSLEALACRGKKIAYEVALGLHFIHGLKCAFHNTNLPVEVALMAF